MKSLINKVRALWKDESAQGATEYILLLVIVIAIAAAFKEPIMTAVREKLGQVSGDITGFNGN